MDDDAVVNRNESALPILIAFANTAKKSPRINFGSNAPTLESFDNSNHVCFYPPL
jgi:hypothetical protein